MLRLFSRRPPWQWRPGEAPTADHMRAAMQALRRTGAKAAADRAAVVAQLAAAADAAAAGQHARGIAASVMEQLCSSELLQAVSEAINADNRPPHAAVEAAAALASRLAATSPASAAALADSSIVGALLQQLTAPGSTVGPGAKLAILGFLRKASSRPAIREAMEAEGAPRAVVATLRRATEAGQWQIAEEAAWALELMAGMSRRLTTAIGEAGGVEAALGLLEAARQQQPALRELPRDEDAAEAAEAALHTLLVLLTDNRRNRVRLQRAGGATELTASFQDERLGWEAREQAVGLLQDLAAALSQDAPASESDGAPAAEATTGTTWGGAGGSAAAQHRLPSQQDEWRRTLLPALVAVLHQRKGQQLQEGWELGAGVLAKYAANGPEYAAAASEAGALPPLVQLLSGGLRAAGGERRTAIAALQALEPLVREPGCQKQLVGPCLRGAGELDLLGLLRKLLEEAAAPELDLAAFAAARPDGGAIGPATSGSQLVAAGWHAAAVAARLCAGGGSVQHQQQLQDALVNRGVLRPLAAFLQVDAPLAAAGGAGGAAALPCAADGRAAERMACIQCELAGLLRSISMRRMHHASLRAAPGLLARLRALLAPGAVGWVDLKAAAKKILQNLGEIPDTDRPLLTYSPQQLGALLESQGVGATRFVQRGVTGAEFVRLPQAQLQELVPSGQQGRVDRLLLAFEAFNEIDGSVGLPSSSISLAKLAAYLSHRGFRTGEVLPLAESLMWLMDADRDDAASFPDFLQAYDEFVARTNVDLQPPSKRRRTDSRLA